MSNDAPPMSESPHELAVEARPVYDCFILSCRCGWDAQVSTYKFGTKEEVSREIDRLYEAHLEQAGKPPPVPPGKLSQRIAFPPGHGFVFGENVGKSAAPLSKKPTPEEMRKLANDLLKTPTTDRAVRDAAFDAARALHALADHAFAARNADPALAQPAETPTREAVEIPPAVMSLWSIIGPVIGPYFGDDVSTAEECGLEIATALAAREEQPAGLREAEPDGWKYTFGANNVMTSPEREPEYVAKGYTETPLYGPEALAAARAEGAREMREAAAKRCDFAAEQWGHPDGKDVRDTARYLAAEIRALPLPDASPRAEDHSVGVTDKVERAVAAERERGIAIAQRWGARNVERFIADPALTPTAGDEALAAHARRIAEHEEALRARAAQDEEGKDAPPAAG